MCSDNLTLLIDEHHVRDELEWVILLGFGFGVMEDFETHRIFFVLEILLQHIEVVLHVDSEYFYIVLVLLVEFVEQWHILAARAAPGGGEIDNHALLVLIIAEGDRLAVAKQYGKGEIRGVLADDRIPLVPLRESPARLCEEDNHRKDANNKPVSGYHMPSPDIPRSPVSAVFDASLTHLIIFLPSFQPYHIMLRLRGLQY